MLRAGINSDWGKLGVATAYGLLAAGWVYAAQRQIDLSQAVYDLISNTFAIGAFLFLTVLTGFVIGRLWALLALLGPLLTLGALEASGYISPWHDGTAPLFSPSAIAQLIWLALCLLTGVGLSRSLHHLRR